MKKKIMIVDDKPNILYTLKIGLEEISDRYEVTGVNGGRECFEFLKKGDNQDIIP